MWTSVMAHRRAFLRAALSRSMSVRERITIHNNKTIMSYERQCVNPTKIVFIWQLWERVFTHSKISYYFVAIRQVTAPIITSVQSAARSGSKHVPNMFADLAANWMAGDLFDQSAIGDRTCLLPDLATDWTHSSSCQWRSFCTFRLKFKKKQFPQLFGGSGSHQIYGHTI